jgi:hypothetical protein
MLTSESIEERGWETLSLKKPLFSEVFGFPTGEVSFAKLGRQTVLQAVKEIFAGQPGRPKPIVDNPPAAVTSTQLAGAGACSASRNGPRAVGESPAPGHASGHSGIQMASASFLDAGLRSLETIASRDGDGRAGAAPASRADQLLAGLFTRDARTNRPVLSIPLPEPAIQERLSGALSAVLNAIGEDAKAADGCHS